MEYDNYKPHRAKKPMTEQQALLKLTTLCTQSEHCSQEMLDKMKKWELPEDASPASSATIKSNIINGDGARWNRLSG